MDPRGKETNKKRSTSKDSIYSPCLATLFQPEVAEVKTNPYEKYYRLLGLEENADLTEIRAAFLRLAKEKENNPSIEDNQCRFKALNEAYQTLKSLKEASLRASDFYTRLNRVFDRVFAIAEQPLKSCAPTTPSCKPR